MRRAVALGAVILPAIVAAQQPDTSVKVTVGGFFDGYFAYDFNRPRALDRAFTTQAARHDEFNVNLAFLDASLTGNRVHGRFAAQFGTSVQANYLGEPRVGTLSGPDVSRFIQEAFVGYQIAQPLWLDGGVFFSPFGSESWISRDNWTYTRSLIADNSPYYEAGIRVVWQPSSAFSGQLHLINGWQNVSETNSDKALGIRLDYAMSSRLTVSYDGFAGNEAPDSSPRQLRLWNELIAQLAVTSALQLRGTYDYGTQQRADSDGRAAWRGYALLARLKTSAVTALAARVEGYSDPEQVIVATGHPYGLRAAGASLNVDVAPAPRLLWRVELRSVAAHDPLFPSRQAASGLARTDPFVVTSLALTF